MTDAARPDPDALLQRMQADDVRAARGKLRVYFGASAGVGKTFAMLAAARALREQGADVVIGVVETHGRAETEALVDGLERLPLREVPYRDRVLREFDLDGALLRRPALVLVDELAHSNAAGSRHPKRWQDIEELQAAGIDVWTTVNVQHLDSLNQAVGGITGVRVWETVPDAVFDGADEVVLVDLPADELLRRLREGRVYLPDQARHAARHFFRKGNLIALRELALRRTADRVDDDVRAYRHAESIQPVWRTREAVLACIGTGDDAEQVVRSARRLAGQLDCDWHVVTIATPRLTPLADTVRVRVRAAMQLAEQLGARTETLAGHDMVQAVAGYVRRHNLTKVLVGRARTDWRAEGSLLDRARMWLARALAPLLGAGNRLIGKQTFADALAAGCPDIDVIRVAADTTRAELRPRAQILEPHNDADAQADMGAARTRRRDYAFAVVWCAGATALSMLARPWFDVVNIAMLFLAGVVGVALRHGRGPAALASVLAVAAFDFFFVPPRLSFAVSDVQYLLTFLVLLTVGLVIGQLTAGLREQAQVAVRRETDARTLYELARELSAALTAQQVVEIGSRFMRAAFDAHVTFFLVSEQGRLIAMADDPAAAHGRKTDKGEAIDTVLAQWVFDHGQPAGTGTHTLPGSTVLYLPLKAPMQTRGVLAVEPRAWHALAEPELRRQADVFATLIAIGIERLHYVEVAQRALVSIESERLRSSLLAAVSHDLRTPLTGLIGMAETLQRAMPPLARDVAETVDAMHGQAARMRTMVVNLLDMARLQQPDVALQRGWQSLEELVGAALVSMREALGRHRIEVADLSALPLVECDAVLMERVLCNLLENAAKYTAPGTVVRIRGELADGTGDGADAEVRLIVEDEGPGVAPGQERHIFEKFTRGQRESATAGVGLGLAVCDAIMQAHGGRIWAQPGARGARFVLALPRGNPPVIEPEPLDVILPDPH